MGSSASSGRLVVMVLASFTWGCAATSAVPGNQDAAPQDRGHPEVGFPCSTDDECLPLDDGIFCNGVPTCDNGLCRVVATPSCDDGVACTDDVCDLASDQCKNVPNNDKCPPEFPICFNQYGCQAAQPCEHDSECDDGLWCNGTESCVQGHCVTSLAPDCDDHDACTVDACDEDTDSCTHTHQQLTGVTDHPDHDFVDANCDGIDGDIAKSIFVAPPPLGADTNAGTMAAPVATIAKGIELATAQKWDVLVALGTYGESVTMVAGVSVYGGYDASDGWKRYHYTPLAASIVMGGVTAVTIDGIAEQTELQLVAVASTKPFTDGASSVGISVVNSTGPILLTDCVVLAGNGADGATGGNGTTGANGSTGGNASGTVHGGQGGSACGAPGGKGGDGVSGTNVGNPGDDGTTAPNGGTGGTGGNGGGKGACSSTSSTDGQDAPPVGTPLTTAGQGSPGTHGGPGATFGTLDAAGVYAPPAGSPGLTAGFPGGGGAGGGSGGGTSHGSSIWSACLDCSGVASGAGGGGGGGGCGGTPGQGGHGGGASFAIVVTNSVATISGCKLTSGVGGAGGKGGDGGPGGQGAGGGSAAAGACEGGDCSTRCGGDGHAGGRGGDGGRGGGGAGGTGGASVCIVYKGTAPTTTSNTCVNGGAGTGGAGGSNGASAAPAGPAGITADVRSG